MFFAVGLVTWLSAEAATPSGVYSVSETFDASLGYLAFAWFLEDGQVRIATAKHVGRVDRTGVYLEPLAPGLDYRHAVSYRSDRRVGEPDTLVGGLYGIHDLVQGGTIIDGTVIARLSAHDVDGNGFVDLDTFSGLLLVDEDSAELVGWPQAVVDDPYPWTLPWPLPDLNGDGHAELFESTVDGFDFTQPPIQSTEATASMFLGTPTGYAATPALSFPLDSWPGYVIAIQADGDPDLELFALLGDLRFDAPSAVDVRAAWIDDPLGTPVVHEGPMVTSGRDLHDYNSLPPALALPDLDGDGADEVVVLMEDHSDVGLSATYDLHLLGSTRGYDLTNPLVAFSMLDATDWQDDTSGDMEMLVVDLDDDGHMDLVAVQAYDPPAIQAWFGPLYEPPEDTGDTGTPAPTGDTGTSTPSADTSPSTAATASTADTGPPPDPAEPTPGSDDPGGCGCTTAGFSPSAAWLGRRRGHAACDASGTDPDLHGCAP